MVRDHAPSPNPSIEATRKSMPAGSLGGNPGDEKYSSNREYQSGKQGRWTYLFLLESSFKLDVTFQDGSSLEDRGSSSSTESIACLGFLGSLGHLN